MERQDTEEEAQATAEARAALLEQFGITPKLLDRLGITLAQLQDVAAQGLSLEQAIERGVIKIAPEAASELMGEAIREAHQHALANGLDRITDDEIDAEIAAVRAARRDRSR